MNQENTVVLPLIKYNLMRDHIELIEKKATYYGSRLLDKYDGALGFYSMEKDEVVDLLIKENEELRKTNNGLSSEYWKLRNRSLWERIINKMP